MRYIISVFAVALLFLFLIASCTKEQKKPMADGVEVKNNKQSEKDGSARIKGTGKGQVVASYFAAPGDLMGCSCSYEANFKGKPGEILFAFTYGKSEMMKNLAYMKLDGEFRTIPMTGSRNYRGQVIYTFEGGGYKVQAAVKNTSMSGKDPEVMSSEATVRVETIDNRPAWLANIKGTCGC